MILKSLFLHNFRNFAKLSLAKLDEQVNVIVAPNGSGKSNLLESIYLLSTGVSPRTRRLPEIIQWNAREAVARVVLETDELAVSIQKSKKDLYINQKKVALPEFLPHLSSIYFQPSDLSLLAGSPGGRRQYVNRLIGQLDFEYMYALIGFNKLLRQRNHILRNGEVKADILDIIEERLSVQAAYLVARRYLIFDQLNVFLRDFGLRVGYLPSPRRARELCGNIVREKEVDWKNVSSNQLNQRLREMQELLREMLREKLLDVREKERELGFSLIGPQRDDFRVFLLDVKFPEEWMDLGIYGSRGQQRMAVVRMKMAESEILTKARGVRPIILLDDVFSELDGSNRSLLIEEVHKQQSFITSAREEDLIPAELSHNSRIEIT